ncbi:ethanolamine utilization protein EutG [Klebsiella pneumoniae]|uniref:Ethanolamine utilization protein EutG n=1 Tax=Klebsiella pneumoniae TaxID=573 RepID=A0A378FYM4_KLEPN|nr:ethanolamine utilization protein EutG [Klebsiella pneumoniae]
MQAELQTALFHAFDTLNLQQMKSFNVPPVDAARRRRAGGLRSASAVPGP